MAREYETIEETVERHKLVKHTCDWCDGDIVEEAVYAVREFSLEFSIGSAYPEGGWKEGWQVDDLCDDCVDKLRVLLEGEGISVTKLEVDW